MTRAPHLAAAGRAVAGLVSLACLGDAGPAGAETITPAFQQALPGIEGKSFTAVTVDFAPGERSTPHRHGGAFVFAYVLRGTIRSQVEGEPGRTYATGESWSEPPGSHHVLAENASATEPARLLAVFVAPTGAALKTDDR